MVLEAQKSSFGALFVNFHKARIGLHLTGFGSDKINKDEMSGT
jgi:hypothetical protein